MSYGIIPNKAGVYKIVNKITGEFYIGSAKNLRTRKNHHFHKLKHGRHVNKLLQEDFDVSGKEAFEFEVIALCSEEETFDLEQKFIDELSPTYNLAPTAGNQSGYKHSEETKALISERTKGIKKGSKKEPPPEPEPEEDPLKELDESIKSVDLSGTSGVLVSGLKAIADPKKRLKPRDARSIRNLKQYANLTDEEFNERMAMKSAQAEPSAEFERLIKKKMDELAENYDLSDMKPNDMETLRGLCQAIITLEMYEQKSFNLHAAEWDDNFDLVFLDKLEIWKNNLRKSISQLQEDLKITRRSRKSEAAESVQAEIQRLKDAAREFYESKHAYVFCEHCDMLLMTAWFLYPFGKNSVRLHCEHCGGTSKIDIKPLYKNEMVTNKPERWPEGM